jgi:transcriptional regulator with XRE-family HTH domain
MPDYGSLLHMTITEAICLLREHSGESQQRFATRAGLSTKALFQYEHGQMPDARFLVRFAALALDGKQGDELFKTFVMALIDNLAAPGWTVTFGLTKGNATASRKPNPNEFRIFRPATVDTEIRWPQAEGKA